jgi:MFS family permease
VNVLNPTKHAQIILFFRGYAAMLFSIVASPVLYNAGVSFKDISLAFGCLYVILAAFEIPTGAWADLFGAKLSSIFGNLLQAIALCVLAFLGTNLGWLIFGFCLYGFGSSFVSGAMSGLLYASAKNHDGESFVSAKYFSITERAAIASYVLASASVGFLSQFLGLKSFIVAAIFFVLPAFVIFFALKDDSTESNKRKLDGLLKKALESFRFISKNRDLRILLPVRMLNQVESILGILWLPWIKSLGGSDLWFSVMATGSYLSRFAVTHYFAQKTHQATPAKKLILSLLVMACGSGICIFAKSVYIGLFGVWIMAGARGVFLPITQTIQHDALPESVRATGLSVMNFSVSVMVAVSFLASASFVDFLSPSIAWTITFISFLTAASFQGLLFKKI